LFGTTRPAFSDPPPDDLQGLVATPNGYEQPHQLFYVARQLKRELLQWLPEAALTIPSFHKIVGERAKPEQGTLFEDPVAAHRERRAAMSMRPV
jgi:hypothetical protein